MSDIKITQSIDNLRQALERLKEAVDEPEKNRLAVDGTIQRFEFAIELFWKTFKRCLEDEGVYVVTPRETLIKAYEAHWFANEKKWLRMLRDRNETSHVYDEEIAEKIYRRIKGYTPEMIRVFHFLEKRFQKKAP